MYCHSLNISQLTLWLITLLYCSVQTKINQQTSQKLSKYFYGFDFLTAVSRSKLYTRLLNGVFDQRKSWGSVMIEFVKQKSVNRQSSVKSSIKQCLFYLFYNHSNMKAAFAVLAGLLVVDGVATNIKIDVGGCKVEKKVDKDVFGCPCVGGSGDYDWHFSELPQGWQADKDRIFTNKGRFNEKKVYGAKVEVFDKNTKESVKRSLFFGFQNGKVSKIADHDFDFDVNELVKQKPRFDRPVVQVEKVKRIFDGADGIGGGCGLTKLRPYLGGYGLYKGDDKNPFRDRLPNDDEVKRVIQGGKSQDVREVVVNAARSKIGCRDIGNFLEKFFHQLRNKIEYFKDDFEGSKKIVITIQSQIKFLQDQLQALDAKTASATAAYAQLEQLKAEVSKDIAEREGLLIDLRENAKKFDQLQDDLSAAVEISRKITRRKDDRDRRTAFIDQQIAELESRIKQLKDNKDAIAKEGEQDQQALEQANKKIQEIKVKIEAAKIAINQARDKIKAITIRIEINQAKIAEAERGLRAIDFQQRIREIKQKIIELQAKLDAANARAADSEPKYTDLLKNYEELSKINENNFNICYRTIFADDKDLKEDDRDRVVFDGEDDFQKYISKVFVNQVNIIPNIRVAIQPPIIPIVIPQISKIDVPKIAVRRCNVFSQSWAKTHGSPFDNDDKAQRFEDDDFSCDGGNNFNVKSFKGRILSINRNIARVRNEQNEECRVYLGGCTRIEAANKQLPQAGDDIYWKGVERTGKTREYNAHHVICK